MKKKLEADLISLAHRILQLKNKSDVAVLQQEALKLYEKLSVLLFVEEHFGSAEPTIGKADVEAELFGTDAVTEEKPSEEKPAEEKPEAKETSEKESDADAEAVKPSEETEVGDTDASGEDETKETSEKESEEETTEEEKPEETVAEENSEDDASAEVAKETASEESSEEDEVAETDASEESDESEENPEETVAPEEEAEVAKTEASEENNASAKQEEETTAEESEDISEEKPSEEDTDISEETKNEETSENESEEDKKHDINSVIEQLAAAKSVAEEEEFEIPDIASPTFEEAANLDQPEAIAEVEAALEFGSDPFEQKPDEEKKSDNLFAPSFELDFEAKPVSNEYDKPAPSFTFDDLLGKDYADPVFIKPEELAEQQAEKERLEKEEAQKAPTFPEDVFARRPFETESRSTDFDKPIKSTLNEKLSKGITIGLNDRIAFMKNLFNNSSEDYNRVLSQLMTIDNYAEARRFVLEMVKPDYNNWEGKEEFEQRFMEIVEKRFM